MKLHYVTADGSRVEVEAKRLLIETTAEVTESRGSGMFHEIQERDAHTEEWAGGYVLEVEETDRKDPDNLTEELTLNEETS